MSGAQAGGLAIIDAVRIALSFPTFPFTALLAALLVFWAMVALRRLRADALDALMAPEAPLERVAWLLGGAGVGVTPLALVATLVFLSGWATCFALEAALLRNVSVTWLRLLLAVLALPVSTAVGFTFALLALRPLRGRFERARVRSVQPIIGRTLIVRSAEVTPGHGHAALDLPGMVRTLRVRSAGPVFRQGQRVVPVEYRPADDSYRVVREDEFFGA